eukprot:UN20846
MHSSLLTKYAHKARIIVHHSLPLLFPYSSLPNYNIYFSISCHLEFSSTVVCINCSTVLLSATCHCYFLSEQFPVHTMGTMYPPNYVK